jgi:hypothetical protein
MKSFTQFILEGGNIVVKHPTTGEDVGSESINSAQREAVSGDIHNSLKDLDSQFKEKHGHSLFGKSLDTGSTFAGSTKHFMNKSISDKEFAKHKPTVGDIDTQIPAEHKDKLEQHLTPGAKFGNMTVVGTKKHGSQISAIMHHEGTGKHHQVDFEPVDYDKETEEPNKLSQFSHSSDWGDVKKGIKGAFHKILLSSTTAAHSKPAIVEDKKGKREIQEVEPHAFSVDKGLRERHKQVDTVSGMPVLKETTPKESVYDTDLKSIHQKLFNKPATDADINHIGSFSGLASHIREHLSPDQHEKVIHKFAHSLWNPKRAQTISKNPIEDHDIKQKAVDELKKHFPSIINKKQKEMDDLKGQFYSTKYKAKGGVSEPLKESEEKDFHITSAMGRFNGPTVEHEKLLNKVFSQPSHKHYVFVLGPKSKEETSDKDPLTADEKVSHLKKLYPHHADSFVAGTTAHTKTPNQAMAWMWHNHKHEGKNLHLNVVAGSGEEGVKNKSSAGGSSDNYKEILNKYNGSKFPERTTETGENVGGDYRMNYKSTNVIENPRGTTSGSVVRKFAKENDSNNPEHVQNFKKLLHSGFSDDHAKDLMSQLHNRLNKKNESYIRKFINKIVK